jgi:hypothetical protein
MRVLSPPSSSTAVTSSDSCDSTFDRRRRRRRRRRPPLPAVVERSTYRRCRRRLQPPHERSSLKANSSPYTPEYPPLPMSHKWYEQIFGAPEPAYTRGRAYVPRTGSPEAIAAALEKATAQRALSMQEGRDMFTLDTSDPENHRLMSKANNKWFNVGRLTTPDLAMLREQVTLRGQRCAQPPAPARKGQMSSSLGGIHIVHEAVSDVLPLHAQYPQATFQAASQMNCLEFPNQCVISFQMHTPEILSQSNPVTICAGTRYPKMASQFILQTRRRAPLARWRAPPAACTGTTTARESCYLTTATSMQFLCSKAHGLRRLRPMHARRLQLLRKPAKLRTCSPAKARLCRRASMIISYEMNDVTSLRQVNNLAGIHHALDNSARRYRLSLPFASFLPHPRLMLRLQLLAR